MKNELKFLGLTPLFGIAGALATAGVWQVYAATFMDLVPPKLAVLSCLVAGLAGPMIIWAILAMITSGRRSPLALALQRSSSLGLGLVVAAELGFYIPLGFFAIAYS